jgi:hypothetical protein
MKLRVTLLAGACASLAASVAQAQSGAGASSSADYAVKSERRSDFTMGAQLGLGFGKASGYPNEIDKIDAPAYRQHTKLALGSGGLVWLGVAFNDYVSFGIGGGSLSLSGNDRDASAGVFAFHVDGYPLFDLSPALKDLGLFGNFGTGPLTIKGGDREQADGGLLSYLEAGVVYERLRLWRFAIGPTASVIHMWSDSGKLTSGLVGVRVAFYGGP